MEIENNTTQEEIGTQQQQIRPVWTYLLLPIAIVIASVLVSGGILYANNGGSIEKIFGKSEPKTGTIQYTVDDIKKWAKGIKGLNREAFNACLDSDKYAQKVLDDQKSGEALGMVGARAGTPSFFLNGAMLEPQGAQPYEFFKQAIDNAQADSIELVEYSDFQCPFCRKFFNEAYQQIKKDYIETGKITFNYHHFPLDFHPAAQKSAEAAECAGEQGKFWEMHDAIFTEQAR